LYKKCRKSINVVSCAIIELYIILCD
jgi:hypothetical protein